MTPVRRLSDHLSQTLTIYLLVYPLVSLPPFKSVSIDRWIVQMKVHFWPIFKNRYHHETWSINHKSYLKHFWQFNRCLTLKHRFWPTLSLTSTPNFRSQSHEFLNFEFRWAGFESRRHHFFSLQPGDQILSINKHDLRQVTKNQAENLINKEINKVSATGQGNVSPILHDDL